MKKSYIYPPFTVSQSPNTIIHNMDRQAKKNAKKVMGVLCVRVHVSYGRLLVVYPWMPEQRQG